MENEGDKNWRTEEQTKTSKYPTPGQFTMRYGGGEWNENKAINDTRAHGCEAEGRNTLTMKGGDQARVWVTSGEAKAAERNTDGNNKKEKRN